MDIDCLTVVAWSCGEIVCNRGYLTNGAVKKFLGGSIDEVSYLTAESFR